MIDKERRNAYMRAYFKKRYATDPEYRKKNSQQAKKWSKSHRTQLNERVRKRYHDDPDYRRRRKDYVKQSVRKRAEQLWNMSDEEYLQYCRRKWDQDTIKRGL